MRKLYTTLGLFLLAMIVISCSKDRQIHHDDIELKFNISVQAKSETKAVKKEFVSGDNIYIFFEGVTGLKYLKLTNNGGGYRDWSGEACGDLSVDDLSASGKKMYAVYFPFDTPEIIIESDEIKFVSSGHSNPALNGLPIFTYYMINGEGTDYILKREDNIATLSGYLQMSIPEGFVQFFINKNGDAYANSDQYRLSVSGLKPVACTFYSNGSFGQTIYNVDQPVWGYAYSKNDEVVGVAFSGVLDGNWAESAEHRFILFDDNGTVANPAISRNYNLSLNSGDARRFNPGLPSSLQNGWTLHYSMPTATQLGGEGGLFWSDYNLGAATLDGFGSYFQWGNLIAAVEAHDKALGYELTFPTNNYNNNQYKLTSAYNSLCVNEKDATGNYRIYDIARAYLGGDWRMPTYQEVEELASYSYQRVITDNPTSIVVSAGTPSAPSGGAVFTSINSIFFPTAGYVNTYSFDAINRRVDSFTSNYGYTDRRTGSSYSISFYVENNTGRGRMFSSPYAPSSIRPVHN